MKPNRRFQVASFASLILIAVSFQNCSGINQNGFETALSQVEGESQDSSSPETNEEEVPEASPAPSPSASPSPSPSPSPSATPSPTPVDKGGLSPSVAPGKNFDLSLWKLTLPIDSSGTFSGKAQEIKPIRDTDSFAPYFFTGTDGAMIFEAPVDGATTSGSKYPRSELREMTKSYTNAAWTIEDGGYLSATVAVNQVPTLSSGQKGRVVIGQIHGPDDELCRLYYDNGLVYFYDDKAGSAQKETQFILKSATGAQTNIPLNAKFDYAIDVKDGYIEVSAKYQNVVYSSKQKIGSFWPGKELYFKAGLYIQVAEPGSGAGSVGSGKGRVSFYRLSQPTH